MNLIDELNKIIDSSYEEPPNILYHYTDGNGLIGIIRDGKVWVTKSDCLNDPVEVQYGRDKVSKVASTIACDETNKKSIHFLESLSRNILDEDVLYKSGHYIASFSIDGDDLSQWKMYANDGKGYSVGINIGEECVNPFYILPVIYDEEIQESIIKRLLIKTIEFLKEQKFSVIAENEAYRSIVQVLMVVVVCLKQKWYENEKEWRVIFMPDDSHIKNELCFRAGKDESIKPYIPVHLMGSDEYLQKIPINTITLGPQRNNEHEPIKLLLRRYDYSNIEIKMSKIKYRS